MKLGLNSSNCDFRHLLVDIQLDDLFNDLTQNLHRRLRTVDLTDNPGVVLNQRSSLPFVSFDSVRNDVIAGIVVTIILQGTLAHASRKFITIRTSQMEDPMHFEIAVKNLRLARIARNAVEKQNIDIRLVDIRLDPVVELGLPQIDCELVGHQFPLAGVVDEALPQFRASVERSEDVATGAVIKARHGSQDLPLGSLTCARCSDEEDGGVAGLSVLVHRARRYCPSYPPGKAESCQERSVRPPSGLPRLLPALNVRQHPVEQGERQQHGNVGQHSKSIERKAVPQLVDPPMQGGSHHDGIEEGLLDQK
jgi:hypothetical protein